jgi:DNA helicase HerA-like ATPase
MIGNVIATTGSAVTVELSESAGPLRVGTAVKIAADSSEVIADVSEVASTGASAARTRCTANLLGEIVSTKEQPRFLRGVSVHPVPGDAVYALTDAELGTVYGEPSPSKIGVGSLHQDASRPALVSTDDLLGKHFAILGATGSGKSCALTVILQSMIRQHPNAHILLLDPHNEYGAALGEFAEIINADNLQLPFWLFNFEEASRVLIRGGPPGEQESQELILNEAIAWARREYSGRPLPAMAITVDTPVPFRVHELLSFINDQMGRLAKPDTAIPYLRLRARLESLRNDRRFDFLFSSEDDVLAEIVGRFMRVPVAGRPVTVVDLSGVPAEIAEVIVSTICRLIFDFAVWCEPDAKPPVLLVCEEAQRYVPADERLGFRQTVQIISRIAKEGRKYGISLALVSQRPSEISAQVLSQCGTLFALRLGSDADQRFVARTLPDIAGEMLSSLPSLPTAQAIVSGEAVSIPMRVRFEELPEERRPRSASAHFSAAWQTDVDPAFIERGIRHWRSQTLI